MASRILAIAFFVLSVNLPIAAAVDYVAAGAAGSEIAGYQSVSSGLVTVYTPVVVTHNPGSQCGVAYRPILPSAACPLMVPGIIGPAQIAPSIEMEFPAGVK